jgi:ribonuclease HI
MSSVVQAIYTDGSCLGNPGPGGWAVIFEFANGSTQEWGGHAARTTNNRMELQAAIEALKALKQLDGGQAVPLFTDSEYVKNGITQWLVNWKKRGWKTAQGKPILNQDLWQTLDELNSSRIQWQYIRAHVGHPGNERADAIARGYATGTHTSPAQGKERMSPMEQTEGTTSSTLVTHEGQRGDGRVQHLRDLIDTLKIADELSTQGYFVTSAELADLMDVHTSAVTSRGDHWTWRNWEISRVKRQGNQILWQLERIAELS